MNKSIKKKILIAAGIYNLIWGAYVVLMPTSFFKLLDMPAPRYIELWQCHWNDRRRIWNWLYSLFCRLK